ncbi:uncharacterized protein [Dysidea avara]|uniref:uncharacterized protein isoform X1 n=1 Tax=Dysidea avara TaxID=196820 RepID=UPI0033318296
MARSVAFGPFTSSCVQEPTHNPLIAASHSEVHNAISNIMKDPLFSIPTAEARECLEAVRCLVVFFVQPIEPAKGFCRWLVTSLMAIVDKSKHATTRVDKEKLWIGYHQLTSSLPFNDKWKRFLMQVKVQATPLLYQHITDQVFESIIKRSFTVPVTEPTDDDNASELTHQDENVIRYVGGYVIHHLKKDRNNATLVPILEKLVDKQGQSGFDPTRMWINVLNRGGLTRITDLAYQCFCDIEMATRKYLRADKTRDMNETFKKKIATSILSDEDLLFDWQLAVGLVDQSKSDKCLTKIIDKWIVIRGFSFAKSMMEMYKQSSKKGTDKSKPLRSKLFTDEM